MMLRAWVVVMAVGLGARIAPAAPIDPSTLVGSVTYSAGGGVFGQCAVSPTTLTLVKGVDFTDTALSFTRQDATFGNVTARSKKKGQRVVARGTGTCGGGGPSWNAKGKYKAPTFAVKMKIKLPGKTAKTTITLARQ